jgi:hypothetical protein
MAHGGTSPPGGTHHGGKHGGKKKPWNIGPSPYPDLSYDPSIEAERQAAARGLQDTTLDVKRARHQARQDFRTSRKDSRITKRRGMQDFTTQLQRGLQAIRFKRQDVKRDYRRGTQDIGLKLESLGRQYATLGDTQLQASNAAGLGTDQGTAQAAAARRIANQGFEQQPLDIALQRLGQDQTINLGRLGIEAGQLRQDTRRGRTRLKQDTRHDIHLAHRDFRRTRGDLHIQLQRARREATIGNADLLEQELFSARQLHPGAFSTTGKRTGQSLGQGF